MNSIQRYSLGILSGLAVLAAFGALLHSSDPLIAIFVASLVAGAVASGNLRAGATLSMIAIFTITAFSALITMAGLFTGGAFYDWPFADAVAIYAPYSGTSAEIMGLIEAVILSLAGGAAGSGIRAAIQHLLIWRGETGEKQPVELDRLSRRLEMLNKEKGKLEEELRICEMIEQGGKTRIARNEITQSDYDSIIYRNDNYKLKLKTRMEKVCSEIQQVEVDMDARKKARESGSQEKTSPGRSA